MKPPSLLQRLTLWLLRRFTKFRELERGFRVLTREYEKELSLAVTYELRFAQLNASAARCRKLDAATVERVQSEVHHALLLAVPCWMEVRTLPLKRSNEYSHGVVAVQLIEGDRR